MCHYLVIYYNIIIDNLNYQATTLLLSHWRDFIIRYEAKPQ